MLERTAPKLDPLEQHFQIEVPNAGASVFLRYLAPTSGDAGVVLYVHGATFPSALSVAHRFDGVSWRDDLNRAGFHVWALDMQGFGKSDPFPEMAASADANGPVGRAAEAAQQVEAALQFRTRVPPAVKVPLGPTQEIQEAWGGQLAYDPARIGAPVAIVRGAWDSLCTDQDAAWLFDALTAAPIKRDVKLSRGGHLMHLEEGRAALHRVARDFLLAGDTL